ncbi:MAG: LamG-like jellyroll fold domain-containing protein, partial [Lachnospiraceae bacterium]
SAVILGSDNNTYHYTAKVEGAPTEDMKVYLGGENCYLDVSEYSIKLITKETQEVPDTPVVPEETDRTLDEVNALRTYFNDFEQGAGDATVVGSGTFEQSENAVHGQVYHNATGGQAIRTNYLLLPEDTIKNATSTGSKEMSVGFWVNVADADGYFFTPLFSAYGSAPVNGENTWPMFILQSRLLAQVNCAGWTDCTDVDNVAGANKISTEWLDDKEWHYYTATITTESVKIYVDGVVQNEWSLDSTDGHTVAGLFSNGADLTYVCLGGNQAWNWGDVDASYQFDDVALYSTALSSKEIAKIMEAKAETPVHVHDLEYHGEKAATCTEEGNIAYWTCTGCDKVFSDEAGTTEITMEDTIVAASGHNLVHYEAKDATSTEEGNIEYWECQTCNMVFTDAEGQNATAKGNVIIGKTIDITVMCNTEGYSFTINGESCTAETTKSYAQGTKITLKVADAEYFVYWQDVSSGLILGTSTSYTFTVSNKISIEAVYNIPTEEKTRVTWISAYDQIIQTGEYSADDEIAEPAVPDRQGYENGRWDLSVEEIGEQIQNGTKEITVKAEYDLIPETYKITVINGTGSGTYNQNAIVTARANAAESGKKFSHWAKETESGTVLSYNESYSFYAIEDITVVAVYVEEEQKVEAVGTAEILQVYQPASNKLSFVAMLTVPEGCTMTYAGIVATSDSQKAENLTAANADYVRGGTGSAIASYRGYKYTWTKGNVTDTQTWYVRAYLVYTDKEGVSHTVYGNLVEGQLSN